MGEGLGQPPSRPGTPCSRPSPLHWGPVTRSRQPWSHASKGCPQTALPASRGLPGADLRLRLGNTHLASQFSLNTEEPWAVMGAGIIEVGLQLPPAQH